MHYESVSRVHPVLCDGGDPNSTKNLIYTGPSLDFVHDWEYVAQTLVLTRDSDANTHCGVGVRLHKKDWKSGQWDGSQPAGSEFIDDTAAAQGAGDSFALETTTAHDGFVVYSPKRFNVVCLRIKTESVGGTPVRELAISNGNGYTVLPASEIVVGPGTDGHWEKGEALIWFRGQPSFTKTVGVAAEGGVPAGVYAVRIRATTAPSTTAGVASSMTVHRIHHDNLHTYINDDNGRGGYGRRALEIPLSDKGISLGSGEGMSAVFSVSGDGESCTRPGSCEGVMFERLRGGLMSSLQTIEAKLQRFDKSIRLRDLGGEFPEVAVERRGKDGQYIRIGSANKEILGDGGPLLALLRKNDLWEHGGGDKFCRNLDYEEQFAERKRKAKRKQDFVDQCAEERDIIHRLRGKRVNNAGMPGGV